MQSDIIHPFDSLTPRAGVCVADGFGIRIFIRRRHLVVQDGLGRHRRERTFARATAGIKRVVVLGHEGFVSLEALRWMADLGIAYIQIDRDGKLIAASAPLGNDDARLRRSQALARDTDAVMEIARWLLQEKLKGQREVLQHVKAHQARKAIEGQLEVLHRAISTEALMSTPEARAAAAYWDAWSSVPVQFVRADLPRIPEHWKTFGARRSPLSGSPRLAFNPANAILNYLYRLLEAETRLALLAVGLDPGLGFFHRDKRGRDNLVVDVMEACRPEVDAYALTFFQTQLFRAADFHETRTGVCRLLAPVGHRLAETSTTWGRAVAPIAEGVARKLGKPRRTRIDEPPTPLTNRNKKRRDDLSVAREQRSSPETPPRRLCVQCGTELPARRRKYCDVCMSGADQGDSRLKRAAASKKHQQARADWRATGAEVPNSEVFRDEILPGLRTVPVLRIMEATGLSEAYCYRIRRGDVAPHFRHWSALRHLCWRR